MPITAAQLVADVCQICKVPGWVAQCGRQLNFTLQDLVKNRNLKVNCVPTTITVGPGSNGPFNLEADYLRTYDMFYFVTGTPYFLKPASLKQFDEEVIVQGLANYPYEWATDLSPVANGLPGLLYVYPQSGTTLTVNHRYFLNRPDIVTPETSATIPWFSDQDYLQVATAARLMRFTDDDRREKFEMDAEKLLEKHLLMQGDEQENVKEVQLDPRRFGRSGNVKPTKLDPW